MEYGILVVEGEGGEYQIIGAVDSIQEAIEKAREYWTIGPENGCIAPVQFVIQRRNVDGFYVNSEILPAF